MLIDLNGVLKTDELVMQTDAGLELETFVSKLGSFPIISSTPVSLQIQNKGNRNLHITGEGTITVLIPCDRCLEDVKTDIKVRIDKEIDMNIDEAEHQKALDEHNYIDGYNLDVDKLVYGEMLLNWPMKVLCSESCKGICNQCGANLNLGTCSCDHTDLDPRMAKIRDIFSKFKEV